MKDLRERCEILCWRYMSSLDNRLARERILPDLEAFALQIRNEARLQDAELIEKRTREDVAVHEESSGVRAEDYYSWRIAQEIRKSVADSCILAIDVSQKKSNGDSGASK